MPADVYEQFIRAVPDAHEFIAMNAAITIKYAKTKWQARSRGEHEKFVNVAGGKKSGQEVRLAYEWMRRKGWQRFTDVVKGPLVRTTSGYSITQMPLSTAAADNHILTAMKAVYKHHLDTGIVDNELATRGGVPKFTQHSLRRKADEVAVNTQNRSGATDDDINFLFGWRLKDLAEEMLKWYAGLYSLDR